MVAKRIALVATVCPACGAVKVYWGSTLLGKISLQHPARDDRHIIEVEDFDTARTGTLRIEVVSSGKKVIIDGVAIRRN